MLNVETLSELLINFLKKIDNIEEYILESKKKIEIPENEFLSVKQAAIFLNLSIPTIYSKVHKRKIPFMKKGKRLYFSKNELREYLLSSRRPVGYNYEISNFLEKKGGKND